SPRCRAPRGSDARADVSDEKRSSQSAKHSAQTARKNATSMPLKSDQSRAPTPRNSGGAKNAVQPGSVRNSRRLKSSVANTDVQATRAAKCMSPGPRKPSQKPGERISG